MWRSASMTWVWFSRVNEWALVQCPSYWIKKYRSHKCVTTYTKELNKYMNKEKYADRKSQIFREEHQAHAEPFCSTLCSFHCEAYEAYEDNWFENKRCLTLTLLGGQRNGGFSDINAYRLYILLCTSALQFTVLTSYHIAPLLLLPSVGIAFFVGACCSWLHLWVPVPLAVQVESVQIGIHS